MAKNILIIEDDKSVARLLSDVLEGEGYRVLVEPDGEWGLRTFQHKNVDLIILDVLVPKLVGFDLLEQLRDTEKGRELPVVMLSGIYRANVHREKMIERHRVLEYFDKPVDLDRLLEVIRSALGQQVTTGRVRAVTGLLSMAPDVRAIDEADPLARLGTLPVPRRGDLEQLPFARLLGQLHAAKATGAVMLRKDSIKKILYLRQGLPVFVKSNLLGECLGHVMVRERLITDAQCDRSVELLKEQKRKQGEILVELGFISPHNLEYALGRQLEIKLYDLFGWTEGKYLFNEKDDYQGTTVALTLSPAELVFEGVRRMMPGERVKRELERVADRVVVQSADRSFRYQALELNPRAGALLDAIDGRRRLRDLLERQDLPPEELPVLLYALICTSLLRLLDAPALQANLQKRDDEVIALSDADLEALRTGEVPVDDPSSLQMIAAARAKARAAKEETLRQADSEPRLPALELLDHAGITTSEVDSESVLEARSAQERGGVLLYEETLDEDDLVLPPLPPDEDDDGGAFDTSETSDPALPIPEPEPEPEPEPLSRSLREEVRARLEASLTARLSAQPAPAATETVTPPRVERHEVVHAPPSRNKGLKLDVDRDKQRQARELQELAATLRTQDHYARLGVEPDATLEEINAAYDTIAREHHPERVVPGGTPRENRLLAEEIALLFTRAKDTLTSETERRAYDREIAGFAANPGVARIMRAEYAYQVGLRAAEHGDWMQAYAAFELAVELAPEEGEYLAQLSWASFCLNPDDVEAAGRALVDLERAVELSPRSEDGYVFLGLILEKMGNREEALRNLRRALQCNADSVRALRALRTLDPPVEKKGGLFGRLS